MIGAGWFGGTELLIILGIVVLIFGGEIDVTPEKEALPSDETPPTS
jgi:hypothetical protein